MFVDQLKELKISILELLAESGWNSLLIDYHPPKVERLWKQVGDSRIYLHCIHPCEPKDALWHPHPWPSSVYVVQGSYEMGIGYSAFTNHPYPVESSKEPLVKFYASPGTRYTMNNRNGWHYVAPFEKCHTMMLVGPSWNRPSPKVDLNELQEDRAAELLEWFRENVSCHIPL